MQAATLVEETLIADGMLVMLIQIVERDGRVVANEEQIMAIQFKAGLLQVGNESTAGAIQDDTTRPDGDGGSELSEQTVCRRRWPGHLRNIEGVGYHCRSTAVDTRSSCRS